MTGVGKGWLEEWMMGAIRLGAEGSGGCDRGWPDDSAFFTKEQRADGSCSFVDTNGLCHYIYMDTFKEIVKEGTKENRGVDARIIRGAQIKKTVGAWGERNSGMGDEERSNGRSQ